MIRQSLGFDDILEKKFKILRTSIMLGNLRNREDTLSEYEETAREIDKIRKSVYEELLASKLYTTITLEEEESRLKDLIAFIENRIQERNDFVDDYIKITSNFLDGLDRVSLENELDNYKNRHNNILEYLNNCNEIEKLSDKIKELRNELEEKYENKANNEIVNSKLEEELIDEFNKYITDDKYYSELNYTDIDLELSKIDESLVEKKSVLDTFLSSYQALVNAGISGAEREEYSSYVSEARNNYYDDLEKKYILNIYKLVLDKQTEYERLYDKRSKIDSILSEREEMRNSLDINRRDNFKYFVTLCNEQFSIIKSQKFNMESIDKLILEITDCENKLDMLKEANNRSEIQDILTEFSVVAPEIEKIELPDEKEVFEEVIKELDKKPDNMVVRIKDPIKINVKGVTDTAKLVMKKVVIVLEPKKFNQKRNKLKEAELELEEEKKNIENNSVIEDVIEENTQEEIIQEVNEDNIFLDEVEKIDTENLFEDEIKIDTSGNTDDIFLDDGIGIELDTKEVFDRDVTETKELNEIKINAEDVSNMTIPTEIYVEEPPVEPAPDLFTVTDPFLDDNEFEVAGDKVSEGIKANMPTLGNIGSVKPTNALSKIENVVRDTDDIILPNLGLVDSSKQEVPIVSENYIN